MSKTFVMETNVNPVTMQIHVKFQSVDGSEGRVRGAAKPCDSGDLL